MIFDVTSLSDLFAFFQKCDVLLASVRNDNYLHVLDMTGVEPIEVSMEIELEVEMVEL